MSEDDIAAIGFGNSYRILSLSPTPAYASIYGGKRFIVHLVIAFDCLISKSRLIFRELKTISSLILDSSILTHPYTCIDLD